MAESLCAACLCPGRNLHNIRDTNSYNTYSLILNEIQVYDLSQATVKVCWECLAKLGRFQKFKDQVKSSYRRLLHTVEAEPSRLKIHHLESTSYPVTQVKSEYENSIHNGLDLEEFEIKTEVLDPVHQEPETFVKDLGLLVHQKVKREKVTKKPKEKKSKVKIKGKRKPSSKLSINDDSPDGFSGASDFEGETGMEDAQDARSEGYGKRDIGATNNLLSLEISKRSKTKNAKKIKEKKSKFKEKVVRKSDRLASSKTSINNVSLEANCTVSENDTRKKEDRETVTSKVDGDSSKLKKPNGLSAESVVSNGVSADSAEFSANQPDQPSEKPQCVECGKMFSSKKTYRYHLNVLHKGQNRYPCPRCGKVYQWKSNLGRHMRTHKARDLGELYCELCDKSFASVATYRQHLKISRRHVSETEFSFMCNVCGKKFVNKTRLRDHIDWEHLKKIKFKCQLCNKPFKCHTSLYVHMQNVHRSKDKKDNLCHVCGKSYQNAAKLKYHIVAMHTRETPYRCAHCAAAFGWYSSLYRHVREVHYKMKVQPKKSKKMKKIGSELIPQIIPQLNLQAGPP